MTAGLRGYACGSSNESVEGIGFPLEFGLVAHASVLV